MRQGGREKLNAKQECKKTWGKNLQVANKILAEQI